MITGKKKVTAFVFLIVVVLYFVVWRKIEEEAVQEERRGRGDYYDIWICSHNMRSYVTDSEVDLCEGVQIFMFKLCQEVGLPSSVAKIGVPRWIPISIHFPNKWLTYGNAPHKSKNVSVIHSMALGINLNGGFIPNSYTIIPIAGSERKCILVVHGAFYGSTTNFTIANIHGDWNGKYDNGNNIYTINWFLRYMKNYLSSHGGHFVLAGDFNIDYSMLNKLRSQLDTILPNLIYPTLTHQIVTYVERKLVSVDHIISNVEIRDLATRASPQKSDHVLLAFKIRLPYIVKPHAISAFIRIPYIEPTY
ncbi:uncharacterized protein LOC113238367 [Hyposmocoma kahamanoa]|uniref:uncharacterized protein LOC113238367 n=1 Tax=Hyposmocoma kahamanoa TaxID=1477025 RepID=UPI000E6D7190|nr:uncharacterized protein LOC113238367 [Hyposmocoma kahamanoa]